MTGDVGMPEVPHVMRHDDPTDALLELIRDVSHRARLLDELLASARDARAAGDRIDVNVEAGAWYSAAAAVIAVRTGLPPRKFTQDGES